MESNFNLVLALVLMASLAACDAEVRETAGVRTPRNRHPGQPDPAREEGEMRKPLAVIVAVVVAFGLGFLVSGSMGAFGADDAEPGDWELDIPAAATQLWFPPVEQYHNEGEPLSDESFEALMAALETAMTAEETLADFEREADLHLMNFIRRLAVPAVSEEQKERIHAYLDALAETHPESGVIGQRRMMFAGFAQPMSAMPFLGFAMQLPEEAGDYPEEGQPFEDWQVDRLLAKIDALLNLPEVGGDFEAESALPMLTMGLRLQLGVVSDDQTARIVAYLDELGEKHPDAEMIGRQRFMVQNLMPGRVAPNTVGQDTDGVEFALEDYRGRIVVLIFSGQWCGPCREEYPYQRGMLEAFRDRDVVLLGVNSDAVLDTIVQAKERERLDYRTWWDGHSQPDAELVAADGPIATQWSVSGWPTIYVIDEEGVIRHTNKRGGALVAAVDKLLMEKVMREYQEPAEDPGGDTEEGDAADDAAEPPGLDQRPGERVQS